MGREISGVQKLRSSETVKKPKVAVEMAQQERMLASLAISADTWWKERFFLAVL